MVLCGWLGVAPGTGQQTQPADTLEIWAPTIFENVRLFDGDEVIPSATVVLESGLVAQIAPRAARRTALICSRPASW